MTKLTMTVPWHDDEPAFSFCSRLAAANRIPNVKDFCWYLELDHRKIVLGDRAEILKLMDLASVQDVAGRLLVKDGFFYDINGQRLAQHSVTRARLRFCSHCLREDLASEKGPLEARAYCRLTWCVTYLRTCPKHHCLLQVAAPSDLTGSHDTARMIAAELPRPDVEDEFSYGTTKFEEFISSAVWGRRASHGWIDEFPLYVVGRMSEWVGSILLFGKTFLLDEVSDAE